MEDRDLGEILSNNPFDMSGPSEYEIYLEAAMRVAYANIAAMTKAIEMLNERLNQHEHGHRAANIAALEMPAVSKDEKPN